METVVGILLTCCAIEDAFTGKISVIWPIAALIAGSVLRMWEGTLWSADCVAGGTVGLVFVGISLVSRQQMGIGDGIVLAVCGFCLGWEKLIAVAFGAMLLFLVVGVVSMMRGKQKSKEGSAFIPYLWVTFILFIIISL